MYRRNVIIMGAAGRDFHDFNTVFRDDDRSNVVAFTAAQIPGIAGRRYPPLLAGRLYPEGIPIEPEAQLVELIRRHHVDEVVFAYSDVSFNYVMERASQVLAAGADFRLLGPRRTMLAARVPVVAVVAVRTGCGKSQTARRVTQILRNESLRVVAVRHPMPYGDLARQRVQRFANLDDLAAAGCTIEEREEYEPHLANGTVVYAGDDYAAILRAAEQEADVIVWDGGNNDFAFFHPELTITVADPLRAGDELGYYPGATNLRMADVVVINKVDTATPDQLAALRLNIARMNPHATVIAAASPPIVLQPELIAGKRVLVIEDGPSVTHGNMPFGIGTTAARTFGAAAIIDPRPYAVGSIAEVYRAYPQIGPLLPAMGYGEGQIHELAETIARVPCDTVVVGTPIDLRRLITIAQPSVRVGYDLVEQTKPDLVDVLAPIVERVYR